MELKIEQETSVKDIQKEFNAFYPYLKIEFFENAYPENKPFPKAKKIDANKLIRQITKSRNWGKINMNGNRMVADFENDFLKLFGLSVQVFRKSGTLWIETTLTDNWTLDKQNKEGEFLNQQSSKSFEERVEDSMIDPD